MSDLKILRELKARGFNDTHALIKSHEDLQAQVDRYKRSLESCGWEDKGGELLKPPVANCSAWIRMNDELQAEVTYLHAVIIKMASYTNDRDITFEQFCEFIGELEDHVKAKADGGGNDE